MADLENTIEKQVQSFYKLSQSISSIDVWLTLRQRLSWNLYNLTNIYEKALNDFVKSKSDHKQKYLRTFLNKKAEKINDKEMTNALSEVYAKDESLAEWTKEMFAEARREALKEKIAVIKTILSSINQIVINLMEERRESKKDI